MSEEDIELKDQARHFLRTPERITGMIEVLRVQRAELAAQSIVGSYRYDDVWVSSSGQSSPTERIAIRIADIDSTITRLEEERASAVQGIEHVLHYLLETERRVITLWFAEGRSAVEIADIMGYDPKSIYKLKNTALLKIGGMVEEAEEQLSDN